MSEDSANKQAEENEAAIAAWEKENVMPDELRDEMETMWEIPQLCHFLTETKDALNLSNISVYEVERMLLMPKASKQLAQIMTCLLSSPNLRTKLHKIPPMPYKFWTSILLQKCKNWFKIYHNKLEDSTKILDIVGIEPEFWKIFPDISTIEDTNFENLSLKEKVWLLKTSCDTLMHARKTIQDEIVRNSEENENEMVLGTDRHGATYFYFPQFLKSDLRVYRHHMKNKVLSVVKFSTQNEKPMVNECYNNTPEVATTINADSNSLLMFHSIVNEEQKDENKPETNAKESTDAKVVPEINTKETTEQKVTPVEKSVHKTGKARRRSSWQRGFLPHLLYKRKKLKKLKELAKITSSLQSSEDFDSCSPKSNQSMCSEDSAKSTLNEAEDSESINEVMESLLSRVKDKVDLDKNRDSFCIGETYETKNFWDLEPLLANNTCNDININQVYEKYFSEKDVRENEEYWESNLVNIDRILEDINLSTFELVAESVDALRDLIAILSLNVADKVEEDDKYKVLSEKRLMKNLCDLVESLEEKESMLRESEKRARLKLRQEFIDYKKGFTIETTWIGENGATLNWWLFGAQNLSLPHASDSILNHSEKLHGECGHLKNKLKSKNESGENSQSDNKSGQGEERNQSTRVLRARGISSYSGQFSSDSESEFDELDRWPEIDMGLLCSETQNSVPASSDPLSSRKSESNSGKDSDQEWTLPRKRKKKKKSQSASRKLQILQNKVQDMSEEVDDSLNNSSHVTSQVKQNTDEEGTSKLATDSNSNPNTCSRAYNNLGHAKPPLNDRPICRIERVDSIHSELDIPDEKPVLNTSMPTVQDQCPSVFMPAAMNRPMIRLPYNVSPPLLMPIQQPRAILQQQLYYRPQLLQRVPQQHIIVRHQAPGPQSMPQQTLANMNMSYSPIRPILQQRHPVGMMSRMPQPRNYRPMIQPPGSAIRNMHTNSPRPQLAPRYPAGQIGPRRMQRGALASNRAQAPAQNKPLPKSTSLIVLSDSDDEIEMIVVEKTTGAATKTTNAPLAMAKKPVITSQMTVESPKNMVPPQMMRRMNQGGISITPLSKPQTTPTRTPPPQVVVVVNETGSHYALALPNGSKLILTPEQVAQIRASNGGKLFL